MGSNTEIDPGRISRRGLLSLGVKSAAVLALAKAAAACGGSGENDSPGLPEGIIIQTENPQNEISPLQQAIANGRLELAGEQDWERYFTPVTAGEAQSLLDAANAGGQTLDEVIILLNFDPRKAPNLVLKDLGDSNAIGIGNIPVGTVFYSPVEGQSFMYNFMGEGGSELDPVTQVYTKNENGMLHLLFTFKGSKVFTQEDRNAKPTSMGDPLLTTLSRNVLKLGEQAGFQAIYQFGPQGEIIHGSLANLLTKDGKIAFIPQN